MTIKLYNNKSPNNSIAKNITLLYTYTNVAIHHSYDLYNVEIIIDNPLNIRDCNYLLIEPINRYYYIDSMDFANQRVTITGHVDVLQTYRTEIEKCKIVVARNENEYNNYINDSEMPLESRVMNQRIEFKDNSGNVFQALNKSMEYIMIVAGGNA